MADPRRPLWRLALAGVAYTVADYALRAAVRLDGTLSGPELLEALRPPAPGSFRRQALPGWLCKYCGTRLGESLRCPGCGHVDPPGHMAPGADKW